ncbi:MAG TPA: SDR family oxidoreductase [Gemmatimonadaceae bacterium]|nr:SDR family oxidoreductase [Gemmatimonadaceae bacterium]
MELGLGGKVALVAASSRGLGRAIAAELAAEGASLILCARTEDAVQRAASEIGDTTGAPVLAIAADVSRREDIDRLIAAALDRFERIDVLVTNAGGPPSGPFESLEPPMWDAAYRLTLQSAVELTRCVLPGMKERRWGRILNVTSITVKQPVDNLMLSNSLRAAVTGFARTLATEVAPFGITVNNLLPGYTRTDRVVELAEATARREGITADAVQGRIASQIPMGRLGEPREFAALAAFLASERASYITGQSVAVDGGWIRSLY